MKYKINKRYVLILILATLGVIAYFYMGELKSIAKTMKHIQWLYMWLAMGCILIYWLIEARTLQLMLRAFQPDIPYLEVVKLVLATQFFNGITPFSTGGQPFQIYVLAKKNQMNISSVTSASIHNFIMYQIVLVLMGVGALFFGNLLEIVPKGNQFNWMVLIGFTLNVGVVVLLLMVALVPQLTSVLFKPIYRLIRYFRGSERYEEIKKMIEEKVALFHEQVWEIIADPKLFIHAFILNTIKLISLYSITYFLCLTVGIGTLTLVQGIIISAYVMLITSMVPIPGASGGAEFGFAVLFGTFLGTHITGVMLLWRFVTYYIGLIVGSMVYYFGYTLESS